MSEKDVMYARELLHTIQIKREAIAFAYFVSNDAEYDDFWSMSKEHQERIWQEYLNQNKDET